MGFNSAFKRLRALGAVTLFYTSNSYVDSNNAELLYSNGVQALSANRVT